MTTTMMTSSSTKTTRTTTTTATARSWTTTPTRTTARRPTPASTATTNTRATAVSGPRPTARPRAASEADRRHVVQGPGHLGRDRDVDAAQDLAQLGLGAAADDGARHAGPVAEPAERHGRRGGVQPARGSGHRLDDALAARPHPVGDVAA